MIKHIKGLVTILIIITSVFVMTCISMYLSYCDNKESIYHQEKVQIIAEDEITIYQNQNYLLSPYLINENQEIENGQYTFETNSKNITISRSGVICAENSPAQEYIVTINEINYNIKKEIKINVKKGINDNLNIVELDGLTMKYQEKYRFAVQGLSNNEEIDNEVFQTLDCNNEIVEDVFSLSIDKNVLTLQAIGIGSGKLLFTINNSTQAFDFNISLDNITLSKDISNNKVGKLLGNKDINNLDTIYYTGDELNVNDLKIFKQLKNIAFENTINLCKCINISPDNNYTYYVKTNQFSSYYKSKDWKKYQSSLKPYKEKINTDKFVIYHDFKTDLTQCEEVINNEFKFKNLTYLGYNHNGWKDGLNSDSKMQSANDIYNSSSMYIDLYAVWTPIKYFVEYHTTLNNKDEVLGIIECIYDQSFDIVDKFKSYKGHTFVGWSRNAGGTTVVEQDDANNIEFYLLESYKITVKNLTSKENDTIKLYDVWYTNKYAINYYTYNGTISGQANSYTINDNVILPESTRKGWIFQGWYDNSSFSGSKVTSISKGTIGNKSFYAKWSIITEDNYIASEENGKRNWKITDDDGFYETITFNKIDVVSLLNSGYSTITLSIKIRYSEIKSGYKQFWIERIDKTKIEEVKWKGNSSGWNIYEKTFTFRISNLLNDNGEFIIEYGARDSWIDWTNNAWKLGYTEITAKFS